VVPYKNFNALADAAAIYELLQLKAARADRGNMGAIDILAQRTEAQRFEVAAAFKAAYHTDLAPVLEHHLELNALLVEALLTDHFHYEALWLRRAVKGEIRDANTVCREFVLSHSYDQLQRLKAAYAELFPGTTLDGEIEATPELNGDLRMELLKRMRAQDPALVPETLVAQNNPGLFADVLHEALGTPADEAAIMRVVLTRSEVDMYEIKIAFEAKYGRTLEEVLTDKYAERGEISGAFWQAIYYLIGSLGRLAYEGKLGPTRHSCGMPRSSVTL